MVRNSLRIRKHGQRERPTGMEGRGRGSRPFKGGTKPWSSL